MRPTLTLAALLASAFAPLTAARAEDAAHGKTLFMADGCYQCHGTVGQGGGAGPRLAPPVWPTVAISAYIRQPAGQMPPYSPKVLSDADIADIHAYLTTIKEPKAVVAPVPTVGR